MCLSLLQFLKVHRTHDFITYIIVLHLNHRTPILHTIKPLRRPLLIFRLLRYFFLIQIVPLLSCQLVRQVLVRDQHVPVIEEVHFTLRFLLNGDLLIIAFLEALLLVEGHFRGWWEVVCSRVLGAGVDILVVGLLGDLPLE